MTQAVKALAAWVALNPRQRLYLAAIYDADQAAEERIAVLRRDRVTPPPASVWRWVIYSIKAPKALVGDTSIQSQMRKAGTLDPGAGSSLKALRTRELIEVRDGWKATILGDLPTVEVRMTRLGRAAARAGRGEKPQPRIPAGMLSEWLWGALAILYRAGDDGCLYGPDRYELPADDIRRGPSWNSLLYLRDRRDGAYMDEFPVRVDQGQGGRTEYRVRATRRARQHYEVHYCCYRELYPTVLAVEPELVEGAHTGLVDHKVRRPPGLVYGPGWRLLAGLARATLDGRCALRESLAEPYIRNNAEVPENIAGIPHGLTLWQAERVCHSSAAVGRLSGRKAGALAEVVQVRNPRAHRYSDEPDSWPLVCLTPAGLEHVRTHLGDYRRLYPDVEVDDLSARYAEPQ